MQFVKSKSPVVIVSVAISAVFVLLLTVFIVYKITPTLPASDNSPKLTGRPVFDRQKYITDTDNDKLPDAIESLLNLDPAKNEVEACYVNHCQDPAYQQAYVKKHNVVIVFDSSGSMSQKTGSEVKMDAAKNAILNYVNKAGTQSQIGLIIYGHQGSNSAKDKALSCSSAEIVAPLGGLTGNNISSTLSGIKPTGWTPIGLALNKAKEMFAGKEKDDNEIFVVTDGTETCDTDPVSAARDLANGNTHVKVNVIGFAVNQDELAYLESINTAGKGSFDVANSSSELEEVFSRNFKNWGTLKNADNCLNTVTNNLNVCIVELHQKIDDFRAGYITNSSAPVSQDEMDVYEAFYYSYITYLQNFQSQKSSELIKIKTGLIKDL